MLIFFKEENGVIYYLSGLNQYGYFTSSTNYDECIHFNIIDYHLLYDIRLAGYIPSWELE